MAFQGDFERILDWLKKKTQILVVTNIFEKYIELFNCDKNSITIFQTNLNCKYDNGVTQVQHNEYDNYTITVLKLQYVSFFRSECFSRLLIFKVAARSVYQLSIRNCITPRLRGLCNKTGTRGSILVSSMVLILENNPNMTFPLSYNLIFIFLSHTCSGI